MQNNRKDQIRMTVGQLSETNYTDVELDCIMILNTTKKPKMAHGPDPSPECQRRCIDLCP